MNTTRNAKGSGPSRDTLFVTHCCKDKDPEGGQPETLYKAPRVHRFIDCCKRGAVLWAIVSAEHALFFPDEWHERYDTELRFRRGRVRVYKDKHPLSPQESQAHVERLVQAVRRRLQELGFGSVEFYVEGRLPAAYPLVMHRALDYCAREHHTVPELLKCIEAAGRLCIVSGKHTLQARLALHQGDRSQGANDASDAAPLPTRTESAPAPPPRKPRASKRLDGTRPDIEEVWQRIRAHEGKKFSQKEGKEFRYSAEGSHLKLSTTNQNLARSQLEKALLRVPLDGPGEVIDLRCPAYIFGILMDDRIRGRDW